MAEIPSDPVKCSFPIWESSHWHGGTMYKNSGGCTTVTIHEVHDVAAIQTPLDRVQSGGAAKRRRQICDGAMSPTITGKHNSSFTANGRCEVVKQSAYSNHQSKHVPIPRGWDMVVCCSHFGEPTRYSVDLSSCPDLWSQWKEWSSLCIIGGWFPLSSLIFLFCFLPLLLTRLWIMLLHAIKMLWVGSQCQHEETTFAHNLMKAAVSYLSVLIARYQSKGCRHRATPIDWRRQSTVHFSIHLLSLPCFVCNIFGNLTTTILLFSKSPHIHLNAATTYNLNIVSIEDWFLTVTSVWKRILFVRQAICWRLGDYKVSTLHCGWGTWKENCQLSSTLRKLSPHLHCVKALRSRQQLRSGTLNLVFLFGCLVFSLVLHSVCHKSYLVASRNRFPLLAPKRCESHKFINV